MTMQQELHTHSFLGQGHVKAERQTWIVICICTVMMIVEIVGGALFGSIALVADGLHMSTHAGALLLSALAYTFARRHIANPSFSFGTGKMGDLAGFASAIILAMISLLIAYEAISRLFEPVPIHFTEAIPIATLGLAVNVVTAWILSQGDHGHHHGHGNAHEGEHDQEEAHFIRSAAGDLKLTVYELDHPPVFRIEAVEGGGLVASDVEVQTLRPDGAVQIFKFADRGSYFQSVDEIPEPHSFAARVSVAGETFSLTFEEHAHGHGAAHRDNNMRAAIVHVVADAAVSVLVIAGLVLAYFFGWVWMDPIAGLVGSVVIASWSYGLLRDTGAILLDMNPDEELAGRLRLAIESEGDKVTDLHLWRLGPGHLGTIISILGTGDRDVDFYRAKLARFRSLSHVTIELSRKPESV